MGWSYITMGLHISWECLCAYYLSDRVPTYVLRWLV